MSCFKASDIRRKLGKELNWDIAYRLLPVTPLLLPEC